MEVGNRWYTRGSGRRALPVRVDIARPVTGIDVEVTATPET
jgi:hypothetical protein